MSLSRKSKVLSVSVPPEIAQEWDNMAKTEDKSRSEIFKDMCLRPIKSLLLKENGENSLVLGKKQQKDLR